MKHIAEEFLETLFSPIGQERLLRTTANLERVARNLGASPQDQGNSRKLFRSNTTVFAMKYKKGVVMAGDRRMASGYYIDSDRETKIVQLNNFSGMACAGVCSTIDYLVTNMCGVSEKFEQMYSRMISPDGQANYMQNILEDFYYSTLFYGDWAFGSPVLAAYDTEENRARIFGFDIAGFYYEPETVAGTGCGFDAIKELIVDYNPLDKKRDAAIVLAVRAMYRSGKSSAGVSDAEINFPSVATIDKKGFRWVSEEAVGKIASKLLIELNSKRGD